MLTFDYFLNNDNYELTEESSWGSLPTQTNEPPDVPDGVVEFEDIKKYILFGKIKDIKLKLELSNLDRQDPNIINLFEFIDLVLLFYNTFNYNQIKKLINTIIDMSAAIGKISIPKINANDEPKLDNNKLQQMQQPQGQPQEQPQEQPQGQPQERAR